MASRLGYASPCHGYTDYRTEHSNWYHKWGQVMEKYAKAFYKVLVEHRGELINYVHTKSPETRMTMGEMPEIDYSGS